MELSTVSNWNKHLRRDSEILCLFYFRKTESNSVMLRSSCEYIRPSSVLALLPMTCLPTQDSMFCSPPGLDGHFNHLYSICLLIQQRPASIQKEINIHEKSLFSVLSDNHEQTARKTDRAVKPLLTSISHE